MINRQAGYTLVELGVVLVVLSAIAIPGIEYMIRKSEDLLIDKSARELISIQEAALRYYQDNAVWPSDVDELKTNNYLPNVTMVSPWGTDYTISSTSTTPPQLLVRVNTNESRHAQRLRARMPFPAVSGVGNTILTSTIGIPGTETAHIALAPRDGTREWTGDHDGGGFSIANIDEVAVNDLHIETSSSVGDNCSAGDIGRDSSGRIMECYNNLYRRPAASTRVTYYSRNCLPLTANYTISGWHHVCVVSGGDTDDMDAAYAWRFGSSDSRKRYRWLRYFDDVDHCVTTCLTFN